MTLVTLDVFPASEAVITELGDDLTPYLAGKATIQFATETRCRPMS